MSTISTTPSFPALCPFFSLDRLINSDTNPDVYTMSQMSKDRRRADEVRGSLTAAELVWEVLDTTRQTMARAQDPTMATAPPQ